MKAVLVRSGIDQAYGRWNAPVDPDSWEFVYVPIPEAEIEKFHSGLERRYSKVLPLLDHFCAHRGCDLYRDLRFPKGLQERAMHLDPDFQYLTYGDVGLRGRHIERLKPGDIVAFYAALRPLGQWSDSLIYAFIGLFIVDEVIAASNIPKERWTENAHTRRARAPIGDVVVRAKAGISGRLERCIPIGEWRNQAYRVRRDLIEQWGGLSVRDGYIQRSAVPPEILSPTKFFKWFEAQNIALRQRNN